jgi:hypothetical protein
VVAPTDGKVLHVVRDGSFGGWGGCIFIELVNPYVPYVGASYYLMAHLRNCPVQCRAFRYPLFHVNPFLWGIGITCFT